MDSNPNVIADSKHRAVRQFAPAPEPVSAFAAFADTECAQDSGDSLQPLGDAMVLVSWSFKHHVRGKDVFIQGAQIDGHLVDAVHFADWQLNEWAYAIAAELKSDAEVLL